MHEKLRNTEGLGRVTAVVGPPGIRGAAGQLRRHRMAEGTREYKGACLPPAGKWELEPAHTTVEFVARHMLTKVRGRFKEFSGGFEIGEKPEDTHAFAEIQAASIETHTQMRDDHLRSGDFLEAEKY